jgi:hypothetical protein
MEAYLLFAQAGAEKASAAARTSMVRRSQAIRGIVFIRGGILYQNTYKDWIEGPMATLPNL